MALVVLVLTAPGPLDAPRAKYARIHAGMRCDEVDPILEGRTPWLDIGSGATWDVWVDVSTGAKITVHYDPDGVVIGKEFDEGGLSFWVKFERFKARLAAKLHHGP
jgi:hypothetical protein